MDKSSALAAHLPPHASHKEAGQAIANKQQIAVLYEQYAAKVYNFMRYRTSGTQDAQDLTQSVFEKVWANHHSYDEQKGEFSVWLFCIARNTLYDYLRDKKRKAFLFGEAADILCDASPTPEGCLLAQESYEALHRALGCLSERQRTFVALKYGSGLRNIDIAFIMGTSERNAGVILHRSLKKLRSILEKENYYEG